MLTLVVSRRVLIHGVILCYDAGSGIGACAVGCLILWLFTLAMVALHSRVLSLSTRAVCRLSRVAVDSSVNSGERTIRCLSWDTLARHEVAADTHDEVGRRTSMPGAWFHEGQKHTSMLEESALDTMPWTLFRTCAQLMDIKPLVHFPVLTWIFASSDLLNHDSNDEVTIGRHSDNDCSPRLNAFDSNAGPLMRVAGNRPEQLGVYPARLPSGVGDPIKKFPDVTPAMHSQIRELSAIGDVAVKDAHPLMLQVYGDKVYTHVMSSNVGGGSSREDVSSDGDEGSSEDGELFNARLADERKGVYHVPDQPQDGALPDPGPRSHRRARSTGYRKRDVSDDDDDEGTGDISDSYWTEQVHARLSGKQNSHRAPCGHGWTDGSSWPPEEREDESDNWRTRNSHVTQVSAPEQCQVKLRRYSSPPLNVNASLSHRVGRYVASTCGPHLS